MKTDTDIRKDLYSNSALLGWHYMMYAAANPRPSLPIGTRGNLTPIAPTFEQTAKTAS